MVGPPKDLDKLEVPGPHDHEYLDGAMVVFSTLVALDFGIGADASSAQRQQAWLSPTVSVFGQIEPSEKHYSFLPPESALCNKWRVHRV